jgi:hypothetical protein
MIGVRFDLREGPPSHLSIISRRYRPREIVRREIVAGGCNAPLVGT